MRSSDVVDVVATVPSLAVVVPRPPASRVPSSTSATSFEPFDAFARALEEKKWRTDFVQMGTAPRYRLRGRVAVDADADDVAAVNEIELLVE